jgi:hypothetical protein
VWDFFFFFFFFHHRVQTGSGAHPASYPNGTSGSLPGGKAAWGLKLTSHLHVVPRSKNEWSYISTPPIRLHGVALRGNLTFTFYFTYPPMPSLPSGLFPLGFATKILYASPLCPICLHPPSFVHTELIRIIFVLLPHYERD